MSDADGGGAEQVDVPAATTPDPSATGPAATVPPVTARRRRPSRWDRPPEPHDWRWVVGGVGRVLVSVGLLMFAFVAYQLWGTGIQTARAQQRLEDRFAELQESATTLPPATTPATTVPPTTEPATSDPATSEPATSSTTSTSTTSTLAPPAVLTAPDEGEPVGRLEIPAIGLDRMLVQGVTVGALRDGPGHFPETPFPGQLGNAAVAGHRTTYGHPFLELDEVAEGDDIVVTTLAGRYTYVVTGTLVVAPGDYGLVVPTVDPTAATLTLLTCHPAYSTTSRLVVVAALDPGRSSVVTLPSESTDDPTGVAGAVLPGDGAVTDEAGTAATTPLTGEPDATAPVTTERDTPEPANTEPANTEPATGPATGPATTDAAAPAATVPEDSATAFSGGWFDDPDAWPQVALWGLALTAVSLGAYALSRRVRRNWVGALVGVVPFVVALYFWFENVNRLLPPNL